MMFSTGRAIWLLMCLYLFVSECKGDGYKPAPNCASLEYPQYTVVHSQKEFEIRSYKDAQWVSGPKISSNSFVEAARKGFQILFGYYKGNNRQNVKINMTTPVLIDVQNSAYTVYFYLPQEYQNSVPPPLSGEIKQVKLPKHKYVAARRFNGFIRNNVVPMEIAALKKSLQGTPYQRAAALDLSTVSAHYAPHRTSNRVNEVFLWFD